MAATDLSVMTSPKCKPRPKLLVRFADDPRLLHEMSVLSVGLLREGGELRYTVLTPDGDVEESRL